MVAQLQQLQQAQAAQAAQAAQLQPLDSQMQGQNGSDAGSQLNTPNSTSVMNLGPGSLGQLFDWGAGQGQQQGLAGAAPQVRPELLMAAACEGMWSVVSSRA